MKKTGKLWIDLFSDARAKGNHIMTSHFFNLLNACGIN